MRVVCINSSNKPSKIPIEQWVKEGEIYTVVKVAHMGLKVGTFGFLLKEIQLGPECFPYEYYSADRFVPYEESVEERTEVLEEEFTI